MNKLKAFINYIGVDVIYIIIISIALALIVSALLTLYE